MVWMVVKRDGGAIIYGLTPGGEFNFMSHLILIAFSFEINKQYEAGRTQELYEIRRLV